MYRILTYTYFYTKALSHCTLGAVKRKMNQSASAKFLQITLGNSFLSLTYTKAVCTVACCESSPSSTAPLSWSASHPMELSLRQAQVWCSARPSPSKAWLLLIGRRTFDAAAQYKWSASSVGLEQDVLRFINTNCSNSGCLPETFVSIFCD